MSLQDLLSAIPTSVSGSAPDGDALRTALVAGPVWFVPDSTAVTDGVLQFDPADAALGGLAQAVAYGNEGGVFTYDSTDTTTAHDGIFCLVLIGGYRYKRATQIKGADGQDGALWYKGAGAPSSGTGSNGDFYLNSSNGDVYTKSGGAWGSPIINLMGPSGTDGTDGTNGVDGAPGGDPGILMTWDTGTADSDPGAGKMRADNANITLAATLFISKTNRAGQGISLFLATLDDPNAVVKGQIVLTNTSNNAQTVLEVTGLTDASGYVKVAITPLADLTSLASGAPISMQFVRGGDIGTGYAATSDTTVTITSDTLVSLETQDGLAYTPGARVRVSDDADPSNWMEGVVVSYDGPPIPEPIASRSTFVFDTKAALQAARVSSIVNSVVVNGYYEAGDWGGGRYKRVSSAPSDAAYIQSADGAYWALSEAEPRAAQLGVTGDGTTDDTSALNDWLAYIGEKDLPGLLVGCAGVVFSVKGSLSVYPNTNVRGTGWSCVIKSEFNGKIFVPLNSASQRTNNARLSNFAINGTSKTTYPASYAFYLQNASEWKLDFILISNVHTAVDIFNTGSGGLDASNYNEFNHVVVNTADNGFVFEALSNSNDLTKCRTTGVTTCAVDSGDQNTLRECKFETFTTGVRALSTSFGLSVTACRFEGGTTGLQFDSGSTNPHHRDNYFSTVTTNVSDASSTVSGATD